MAHRFDVKPAVKGLSKILNVTKRVGRKADCPNEANDVQLVQSLIRLAFRTSNITKIVGLPDTSGSFDATTGFWIYHMQATSGNKNTVIDGVVSPARGASYGGGALWTIFDLNVEAKSSSPVEYEALMRDFRVQ